MSAGTHTFTWVPQAFITNTTLYLDDISVTNAGSVLTANNGSIGFGTSDPGNVFFDILAPTATSSAVQIQTSSGNGSVFNVDTTTNSATINQGNLTVTNLSSPTNPALTSSGSGGTLAAATYYYAVAAVNANGTTPAVVSSPASVTTSGSTSQNTLTWSAVTNAASYNVYRSTDNVNWKVNNVSSSTLSAVDNGTNFTWSTSASLPTTNTTGGNVTVNGTGLFANATNSNHAFQIQDASAQTLLNADTTNKFIGIGASNPQNTLDVQATSPSYTNGFESGTLGAFSGTNWSAGTGHAHSGSYSANSTTSGSTLSMTQTLNSPGQITFWADIDPSCCGGSTSFAIDGVNQFSFAYSLGAIPYTKYTYMVPAGTHTFTWNLNGTSGNHYYVDDVTVTNAAPQFYDSFETGALSPFTQTGGFAAQGSNVHSGNWSAGAVTNSGTLTLTKTLTSAGTLSFWAQSANGCSGSNFLTDNGTTIQTFSSGCGSISYTFFSFAETAGTHTFVWNVGGGGAPSLYIDDVTLTGTASTAATFIGGNVGIGTSFPSATLQVSASSLGDTSSLFNVQNAAGSTVLNIASDTSFNNGFESNALSPFTSSTWTVGTSTVHSGTYSAFSNGATNTISLVRTLYAAGTVSYWGNQINGGICRQLNLYIDGVLATGTSSCGTYQQVSTSVGVGTHTFTWVAGDGGSGAGSAYLDDVIITNSGPAAIINNGSVAIGTTDPGAVFFDIQAPSATAYAFQVQGVNSSSIFNIDTTTNSATINQGNLKITNLSSPSNPTLSSSASGGTLAAGTYYYMLAATNVNGSTPAVTSSPASVTTSGTTSKNTLTWTAVTNAGGYDIYRSTNAGSTWQKNSVSATTTSIIDNGTNFTWSTTATPPTTNTTGGNLTVNGTGLFKNSTNSTNAFNVQDASGASALNVDTTNRFVGINASSPSATLDVRASSSSFMDGFETGALSPFTTTGGWTVDAVQTHSGGYAADGTEFTTLSLTKTLNSTGTISFYGYSASYVFCRASTMYIDGTPTINTTGCNSWIYYSASVSSGTHTITWTVNTAGSSGGNFWIDDVTLTNAGVGTAAIFNGGGVGIGTYFPNQTLDVLGTSHFQASTDSASLFQIQNAAGTNVLNLDSTTLKTTLNQSKLVLTDLSAPTSPAVVAGANTGGTLSGAAATTYYYKVTALNASGETLASSEVSINGQSFTKLSAPGALTVGTPSAGGSVTVGTHSYKVTFVTANGETTGGTTSSQVNVTTGGTQTVPLTGIPTGASGTTARKIYRTVAGDTGNYLLVTTINDNTTTTFNDTVADGSLGAAAPASNTATTNTNNATVSWTAVTGATSYKVYRGLLSGAESAYQTSASSPFTDTGAVGTGASVPTRSSVDQVGVGTSTPAANLDVEGAALFKPLQDVSTAFQIQNSAGNALLSAGNASSTVYVINDDMMSATPSGTLLNSATYSAGNYVQLNPASSSTSGQVEYNPNMAIGSNYTAQFDFWAGGGTGADATWFYSADTSTPTSEAASAGGYQVYYSEFSNKIALNFNGTDLATFTQNSMGNSAWHTAKIIKTGNNFQIFYDGTSVINFTDSTTRTSAGTKWGLGGRSGGSTNNHRVRNFTLSKAGAGNIIKVGSNGTNTVILQVDSATTDPSSNLDQYNGGIYYNSTTGKLMVISNNQAVGLATSSTATKVIAMGTATGCSGSSPVASLDTSADYVITSCTSAQNTINTAITAVSSTGGTVYLKEGTYIVDGNINMASNVTLMGSGPGTVLKLKDSTNSSVDLITANTKNRVSIQNLKLDGNRTNNSSGTQRGISIITSGSGSGTSAVQGTKVNNVEALNFRSIGVLLSGAVNSAITNSTFVNNGDAGIRSDNSNGSSDYNVISNNIVQGGGSNGIYLIKATNNTISGNTIQGNTGNGISFDNINPATNNTVTGNTIVGNGSAGITSVASDDVFTGNEIRGNGGDGIMLNGSARNIVSGNDVVSNSSVGVHLFGSGATNNTISGNTISSNTSNGVYLDSGPVNNTINSNQISSNSNGVYIVGSNNTIQSNYFGSNSGNGVFINNSSSNIIDSNTFYNNAGSGSASTIDGFFFNGASSNQITNNKITDTAGTGSAIAIPGGFTNTFLSGNLFSGTGATTISDSGTGTIYNNQSKTGVGSDLTSKVGTNSTTAYQFQDSSGVNVMNIDTSTDRVGIGTGTSTPSAKLQVAGTTLVNVTSTSAFQVQDSGGTNTLLSADTSGLVITIAGNTTTFASLTVNNAHVKSLQTTAPTIGTPTNCGTSPSAAVTANSTDSAGSFKITAGTGGGYTTCDTVFTFNKAYGAAPKAIVITPTTAVGSATGVKDAQISNVTSTTFTVKLTANPSADGEINAFYYWVVE